MAGHAFISYSHLDAEYVDKLAAELRSRNLLVWTDRGVEPGQQWIDEIEREIEACAAFIPIVSANSQHARWVRLEILRAQELGKPILPLWLSGNRLFMLTTVQDEDVRNGLLPGPRWIARLEELLRASTTDPPMVVLDPENARLARTLTEHTGRIRSVAFSPDSRRLACGAEDMIATVWAMPAGRRLRRLEYHRDWICAVAWEPDGNKLATGGGDRRIVLWTDATIDATLTGHRGNILSLAWSPGGQRIASASADGTVRVMSPSGDVPARQLIGHTKPVFSVSWARHGQIATGSADLTARVWDPVHARELTTLTHRDAVRAVAWSPDGSHLATACSDGITRVWDTKTGTAKELTGHAGAVWTVAWSPDGQMLASGGQDGTVRLWRPRDALELSTLTGTRGAVRTVAWSPATGELLTSGDDSGSVQIWTLAPGQA